MRKRNFEENRSGSPILRRTRFNDSYNDSLLYLLQNPNNFFLFPLEIRQRFLQEENENVLNYPPEYFDLYRREKNLRKPIGYTNTYVIDNVLNDFKKIPPPNANCLGNKFSRLYLYLGANKSITYEQDLFDPRVKSQLIDNSKINEENSDEFNILSIAYMLFAFLENYGQYVSIAGGYALAYYTYYHFGIHTSFDDVDLFIHSCNEEIANEIVQKFISMGFRSFETDDSITIFFENIIIDSFSSLKIQIIKRLYFSPSEVIHGFDIDSSCILVNNHGKVVATERFIYATRNRCNFVNFDRLSPSYSHRLIKYLHRGYNIWIPQMEFFKSQTIMDATVLSKNGSGIILRKLLNLKLKKESYISDYAFFSKGRIISREVSFPITFKILNPGEQIINTFHREILQDIRLWYPILPENIVSNFILETRNDELYNEVKEKIPLSIVFAKNLVRRIKISPRYPVYSQWSYDVLMKVFDLLPNAHVYGDIPHLAIGGDNISKSFTPYELLIFVPSIDFDINLITYQIWKTFYISRLTATQHFYSYKEDVSKSYYIAYGNYKVGEPEENNFNEMKSMIERYTTFLLEEKDNMQKAIEDQFYSYENEIEKIDLQFGYLDFGELVLSFNYKFKENSFQIVDDQNNPVNLTKNSRSLNIRFVESQYEEETIKKLKQEKTTFDVLSFDRKIYTTEEHAYQIKYRLSNDNAISEILPYDAIENYTY